jgi:putative transposase
MFSLLGKLMGFMFLLLCKIHGRIHAALRNPSTSEIAYLREEIRRLSAANRIMKQFIRKRKKKPSFLVKLKFVVFAQMFQMPLRRIHRDLPSTRSTIRRYLATLRMNLFGLRQRSSRPKSSPRKTPPAIAGLVHRIKADNPSWGYLRIALQLWRLQVFLSPSTVRRVLLRTRHSPWPNKGKEKQPLSSITAQGPNVLWSLDLTTVYIFGAFPVYVFGVIDHYSRKVFCLASTFHPTAEWVVAELKMVIDSSGCPGSIITDNGAQFVSAAFKKLAASLHFNHIKTAIRHPQTNGKIERFFQSLKHEFLCLFFLTSKRHLDRTLSEYLLYYNQFRLHEAIEGQTPDDVHHYRQDSKPDKSAKHIRAPIEEIRMGDGLLRAYRLKQAA